MATQPSFSNYYTVADLEGFQWVAGEGVAGVGGGGVVKPYWNFIFIWNSEKRLGKRSN